MSYVLIITQDHTPTNLNTDAQLIAASDWNKLPIKDKAEIIALSFHVTQVQSDIPPDTNEELIKIIQDGTPIMDINETIY